MRSEKPKDVTKQMLAKGKALLPYYQAGYRAGLEAVEKAAKNTCVSGLGPKCNHVEHRVGREIMRAIREMKQKAKP